MKNIALHILDLVQNSARAKAGKVMISVMEDPEKDRYILSIVDDGGGMDENQLRLATDPFYTSRSTRKVGLGLQLIYNNKDIRSQPWIAHMWMLKILKKFMRCFVVLTLTLL